MAEMKLEEFYQTFYQDTLTGFQADQDASQAQIFTQLIGNYLEQDGDVADITWNEYIQDDIEDEVQVTIIATGFESKVNEKDANANRNFFDKPLTEEPTSAKKLYGGRISNFAEEEPKQEKEVEYYERPQPVDAGATLGLPKPNMELDKDSDIPPFLRRLKNKRD